MVPRLVSIMWTLQKTFGSVVQIVQEVLHITRTLVEAYAHIVVPANVQSAVVQRLQFSSAHCVPYLEHFDSCHYHMVAEL